MRRVRIVVAVIFAISTVAIATPSPAHACAPEEGQPCECADDINRVWQKVFGRDLVYCPM